MGFRSRAAIAVLLAVLAVAVVALGGCEARSDKPETNSQGDTLYTPAYAPTGRETATLKTSKGDVVVELYGDKAPVHVGNFVELVKKGYYDGTKFHRYEPGFVVQGGDPQTRELTPEQVLNAIATGNPPLGTGGPGYVIRGEFDPKSNPHTHVAGALGMARSQDPDSAGSQFYFALEPLPMLDGNYTVFGAVTQGLDVVRELRVGDTIESVTINGAD